MSNRFAVILTHNRPELLTECVAAITPQVDTVIVIDNASTPPVDAATLPDVELIPVEEQPPNLARMWNLGIDAAVLMALDDEPQLHIAFLCDDAIVPDGWFAAVAEAMAATGAAAGCSNPWGNAHPPQLKTTPDSDLMGRMVGWAFILDGNKNLRADESMRWWWCDSDLDLAARAAGGMVMVGGYAVPNRLPNDFTCNVPGLSDQAGRDGETFAAKHGGRPW